MITRNLLKEEIDRVRDSHLEVLFRIIKALEEPLESGHATETSNWNAFIDATYGCLTEDTIERGEQGRYEAREAIR